jgi:antitoxin CptB
MDELARLRWRCRRGMLELDLLLGGFLDSGYAALDEDGRRASAELIELPDGELLQCLLGVHTPSHQGWSHVIARIRHAACPET